ncbi:pectate lyase [Vigna angularis]|uniref:Pectate lyase n=1 Tax=Phaseolus angularis TaxID=3914 RepID=A0A8T0KTE6_PHAAN|nr:pectate lyase [Vigna angularis]
MFQATYILLFFSVLSSFLPHGTAAFNLTLPGQHPDPEAVATQVHRRVNASMGRREMLRLSEKDVASCLTGNPIDDCWKCDPDWANNRQRLADCGIGFGQNAKGGKGGEFYIVTDSSDEDPVNPKPGTLRYAVIRNEPLWIVFPSNMMIKLSQELIFNSYKTIDGRGADVHIVGGGCITLQYISNVIIHNIHIHHCHPSGYIHVVNNDFTRWEMYAIGGSGRPTINSQGNRYTAPEDPYAKQITKRLDAGEGEWSGWNWRSEGDVMLNGAFFVASGGEAGTDYQNAYSVEPKNVDRISLLTMSAGVLGVARLQNKRDILAEVLNVKAKHNTR